MTSMSSKDDDDDGWHIDHVPDLDLGLSAPPAPLALPADYLGLASSCPISALVIFTPLGIAAHYLQWDESLVFLMNFLPIIPLAYLLGEAAQQAALSTGETIGGLITATFGNAPELILSCAALRKEKVELVQASLVGSILSTLVLMTGLCLFVGGIYHKEQTFSSRGQQRVINGSLHGPVSPYNVCVSCSGH